MTTEQKAKAYDEAITTAKQILSNNCSVVEKLCIECVFPELKESEDERIRKAIIATIHLYYGEPLEDEAKEMIAWLEKQGKQKGYTFKSIPRLLDMIEPSDKANAYCQKLIDALAKEGYNTDAKIVEEVLKGWNGEDVPMAIMDEQKPVFEMKTPEESLGIDSDTYNKIVDECIYGEQKSTELAKGEDYGIDGLWHAQRILEKTLGEVDGYQTDDGILDHKAAITAVKKLYGQEPTDNEMKEALRTEYEKGRADAIAEMQNHAWSEEDECYMSECIGAIATKDGWSFEEKRKTKHWLKSLKDRYSWKPSDVQIKALTDALSLAKNCGEEDAFGLRTLYEQLKKLKEE